MDDLNSNKEEDEPKKQRMKEMRLMRKRNQKKQAVLRRTQRLLKRGGDDTNFFLGQHKWLGGCIDSKTGIIYGIPSHALSILCIHPSPTSTTTISTITVPLPYRQGHFKWLRGIIVQNYLYGIPSCSTHGVLKVPLLPSSPTTTTTKNEEDDEEESTKQQQLSSRRRKKQQQPKVQILPFPPNAIDDDSRWMWHGGAYSKQSHAIYCIPSNARRVLKVDIETDLVTEIGLSLLPDGQNKWYGGILGKDGCIYGIVSLFSLYYILLFNFFSSQYEIYYHL